MHDKVRSRTMETNPQGRSRVKQTNIDKEQMHLTVLLGMSRNTINLHGHLFAEKALNAGNHRDWRNPKEAPATGRYITMSAHRRNMIPQSLRDGCPVQGRSPELWIWHAVPPKTTRDPSNGPDRASRGSGRSNVSIPKYSSRLDSIPASPLSPKKR